MAALTLTEIRDHVRQQLDLEVDELPDEQLNHFVREAFNRIAKAETRWPFYDLVATFITEDSSFSVSSMIETAVDKIVSLVIQGPSSAPLKWIDHEEALARFGSGNNQFPTGTPTHFSTYGLGGSNVHVWPRPTSSYTYYVRYIRPPVDWITLGQPPDIPEDMHDLLLNFSLARAYLHQDEADMAAFYQTEFDRGLDVARKAYIHTPFTQPLVLGQTPASSSSIPSRLRFPFEG